MKPSISIKFVAAAALAASAFGVASAAYARSDVYFSIGVQGAPVYVQPQPVYVQPRPVYVQPPVYAAPAEVYVRRGPPVYDGAYDDERAWRRAQWRRHYWRHHHRDWDRDSSRGRNSD